nr:sulfotransferase family 2 domain-containing protein [Salipiger mangrovisoli]
MAVKNAVPAPALGLAQSVSTELRQNPHYRYLRQQKRRGDYAFIHINKCGGTSIEKALSIPVKIHDTAEQRRRKIGRRAWDRLFTFALVRHPYDRVASLYRYRVRTRQTGMGDGTLDLNTWVEQVWGKHNAQLLDQPIMFAPCMDWITDPDGKIIVDEILKLEEINQGWAGIAQKIDGPLTLPRENTTVKTTAPRDLLSASSKDLLRTAFAADFESLGYDA